MIGELVIPPTAFIAAFGRAWKTQPKREWRGILWRERGKPWIFQYVVFWDEKRGEQYVSAYDHRASELDTVGLVQEVTRILVAHGFADESEWSTPNSDDVHTHVVAREWLRSLGRIG